ncbi:putative trehalose synthase-like protein [Clathrospora elynae]|uniref:Putative trehalose synthase-like protein n=1 Tax=Clathrospora elynae TaxID=706981 RepID=A0A6A5SI88_9PLEO|nr:putative trehalose synthase-like protein [Clathrospora elynae]
MLNVPLREPRTAEQHRPAYRRQSSHERRQRTINSFRSSDSIHKLKEQNGTLAAPIESLYAGLSAVQKDDGALQYAVALHDGTYGIRCETKALNDQAGSSDASSETASGSSTPRSFQDTSDALATEIVGYLRKYRKDHMSKPMGAALTAQLASLSPHLAVRLWTELDIVPFVLSADSDAKREQASLSVDEEAEYMARKTVKQYNVKGELPITFGHHHYVNVDDGGRVHIADIESYHGSRGTVRDTTWQATLHFADSLKKNKTKVAFFNSTPQGGGVALMRHALIRLLRLIGVDCTWYVPYGRTEIFRITKDNHNILQGVATKGERLTTQNVADLDNWVMEEARKCHWLEFGGPLASREKGGADVIIVDDPQMPSLVSLAKERDPNRPVIFRSHIQVRGDLADQEDTATAEVWRWIWNHVKNCDVFVSHPVRAFVPKNVTPEKVGYLPATTDWKDGLNKEMSDWDQQYYMHEFKVQCFKANMRRLAFPDRQYIVQIARFDPAKGIPDLLASYAKLRNDYMKDTPFALIPQLVIAGHGAVDDPDATIIFDETEKALNTTYAHLKDDVIVMRIGPSDQVLNALMSCAYVALQLSTREGFEVKVSEALHKGIPIIATRAGGIPLQVQHGKSGYLVQPGDHDAVASHLYDLFTDTELRATMAEFAENNVSDEVSTVGNALAWLYLADTLARGEEVKPQERWINDLARDKAGVPYLEDEVRLERNVELMLAH